MSTIDTPHQGSFWAGVGIGNDVCAAADTVNKKEMHPTESVLLAEINHRRHNWPLGTQLDAIVSYQNELTGDGVVSRASQDIEEIGEYWATHPHVRSYARVFQNLFQGNVILHRAVHKLQVTASLVQGLVEEIDAAAPDTVSLTGAVRVTHSNAPIAGATVIFLDGPNVGRSVKTSASGKFRFDGLTRGNANLSALAPGYLEARGGLFVEGLATLDFSLAPTTTPPTW